MAPRLQSWLNGAEESVKVFVEPIKMVEIPHFSAKNLSNSELLTGFLAEIEGIQAISIRHIFRAKVS